MKTFIAFTTVVLVARTNSQNFAFPESPSQNIGEEKQHQGRVPLYAPDKCPVNQLLYPGDQKTDWICDCGPGYIYYPPKDQCYHAYRQGPCKSTEHLVLKPTMIVPECVRNPCRDGFALYRGKCYEMGKPNGPCRPFIEGGGIFDVNATTLVIECLQGTDPLSLFHIPKNCPPGSKRDSTNQCRENYNICVFIQKFFVSNWNCGKRTINLRRNLLLGQICSGFGEDCNSATGGMDMFVAYSSNHEPCTRIYDYETNC